MKDILFRIPLPFSWGSLPLHSYGMMAMFGFLAGLLAARWRAKRTGIPADSITDICIAALLGGMVGSRVFFVIQNRDMFFDASRPDFSVLNMFKIWEGGLVFYGGLFGAMALVLLMVHLRKVRLLNVMDTLAPSLCLGMAFGRIGCFLRGCCYGIPLAEHHWFSVVFPPKSLPYSGTGAVAIAEGTPLFPSQVLSSLNMLVLFAALSLYFRYRRREGEVCALLLILYSAHRFGLEFVRGDTHPPGTLSVAQWISVAVFFAGLGLIIRARGMRPAQGAVESASGAKPPRRRPRRRNHKAK